MNVAESTTEYDIAKTCLCCLKNEILLYSIYKSNLKKLFITLTHLEISEHDGYPSNICIKCIIALKISSSFLEQCITSYKTLTESRIKKDLVTNSMSINDDIVSGNSSDVVVDHLRTSFRGNYSNQSSIKNKTEVLYLNHDDIITEQELVEEAKNKAKTLRISLSRMHPMSDNRSTNSNNVSDWEVNNQKPMILDDTNKSAGSPVFDSSGDLKSFITIETREYECTICGFRDRSEAALLKHQISHKPKEVESIQCDIIKSKENGKSMHTCSMCEYTNPHLSVLKIHVRKHTGERPFKCDVCPYACKTFHSLKRHKIMHPGERPFKCNICPFASNTPLNVKRHKTVHLRERLFRRNINKTFQSLKRYKTVHGGPKRTII